MGVIDKLKNALFEVEYVEVEEPEKEEKKEDKQSVFERVKAKAEAREKKEAKKEKPIAKKIVLPGKKEEKIEELEEEELKDEDFEIRPKDEMIKEESDDFKFMDDKDFEMDYEYIPGEAEILNVIDEDQEEVEKDSYESEIEERKEKIKDFYRDEVKEKPSRPYGMDNSYKIPTHEYGKYDRYEEKTYFKPSPIISPIYGILDKNYKKEDVKEKEVRLTSYTRGNVSVDDIRNKAYGSNEKEDENLDGVKFEVEEEEDNKTVNLNEESKPEVKEITVGDAVEYFQDLGLEYNVDYVDASVEKTEKKKSKPKKEEPKTEIEEEPTIEEEIPEIVEESVVEEEKVIEVPDVPDEEETKEEVSIAEEIEEDIKSDDTDDDNLFDLIDSMYEENKEGE